MQPAAQGSTAGSESGGGALGSTCCCRVRSTSPSRSGAIGTNLHKKLTASSHGLSPGTAPAGAASIVPATNAPVAAITLSGTALPYFVPRAATTASWVAVTFAWSSPHGSFTPTRASRSHRTHCDDRASQLLCHRVNRRREAARRCALRMVMQEFAVGLLTERRVPRGALDKPVPGFVDRTRRHTDDLVVPQRGATAAQLLQQTCLDELARLPRARLEHGSG